MPIVQFSDGLKIEFSGNPTEKDIQDAYNQAKGINNSIPSPQVNQSGGKDLLQKTGDIVNSIFPGKEIGKVIGSTAQNLYQGTKNIVQGKGYFENNDLNFGTTPLQVGADVAQAALTVATPGSSAATIPGRIALNSALGATFGATQAIKEGSLSPEEIAKQAGFGAITGGVTSGLFEGLSSLTQYLPKRLINVALPQLKKESTIEYALDNVKLGPTSKMVEHSEKSLANYNSQIKSILEHPDNFDVKIPGVYVEEKILKDFPNAEYTTKDIFSKIKSLVPSESKIVSKLEAGTINAQQANSLRQKIDSVTYKTVIDSPEVRANKDLAASVGNALREAIQTQIMETRPIFANYSKEINLFKALQKAQKRSDRRPLVGFRDLLALGLGSFGGGVGAAGAVAAERLATSPGSQISAAKLINKSVPVIKNTADIAGKAGAYAGKTSI